MRTGIYIATVFALIFIVSFACGEDVDIKAKLFEAAAENEIATVKRLVEEHEANVNSQDDQLNTPLHFAAQAGNIQLATYLLNKGASVDAQNLKEQTPLILAVLEDDAKMIQFLLEKGSNPRIASKEGSAMLVAAEHKKRGALQAIKNFLIAKHLKDNPEAAQKRRKTEL